MRTAALPCIVLAFVLAGCSDRAKPATSPPSTNVTQHLTNTAPLQIPAPASTNAPTVSRSYILGKVGVLRLNVPSDWRDQITNVLEAGKLIDAVRFTPVQGADFGVQVEVIYVGMSNAAKLDLKSILQNTGKSELTNAVEPSLDIHEFQDDQVSGCYFVVTDRRFSLLQQPVPGEYRYLLHGYAKLSTVVLPFGLVSDHIALQQPALLEMIKSAGFSNGVPPAPPPH